MAYPALPGWRSPYRQFPDPFGDLTGLRAEMGRLMAALSGVRGDTGWSHDVDIDEDETGWTVTARLPGFAPEEVSVDVEERQLRIRASTGEQQPDTQRASEAAQAAFDYRLALPGEVDTEQVDATMDHGLLRVRLPRSTQSRRRHIQIGGAPAGSTPGAEPGTGTAT